MRALALSVALALSGTAAAQDSFLGRTADEWSAVLTSGRGQQRVEAAWALAQIAGRATGGPGDHVQFAELVKLISDGDPTVRYWGVTGLTSFAKQLKAGDGARGAALGALAPLLDDK